jgi:peptidoglycan/xylan/chitin deacetylase (PgdA/CDA1 family)
MARRIASCVLVALAWAIAGCASDAGGGQPTTPRPVITVTVDDVPEHGGMAPGETRLDISRRLVAALEAEGVPAYGFINGSSAEMNPDSTAALEYWAGAFPVGNHTWSHPNINALSAEAYREEIARNEPLLERLSRGRDWRWLRYPFQAEGDDADKRLAVRRFLASRNYRIAAVTMSFSDWKYNDAYARCAVKGDEVAIARLEEDWLDAVRYSAEESRSMAKALYGGDIPYVLLAHIGSFDARMFPRTLALYREMGFRFVSLEEAQNHPAYAHDNDPAAAPEPNFYEMMGVRGLPLPADRVPEVDLAGICAENAP